MEIKTGPPHGGGPVSVHPQPIVLQPLPRPRTREDYKARTSKILGIIQIVAGILIVIFSAVAMRYSVGEMEMNRLVQGIGALIMFCLSGGFAIASGKKRTPCLITAHMVLAILASLSAISLIFKSSGSIGMAAIALRDDQSMMYMGYDMVYPPDYKDYNPGDEGKPTDMGGAGRHEPGHPEPNGKEPKQMLHDADGEPEQKSNSESDRAMMMEETDDYWFFGYDREGRIKVNIAASSMILLLAVVEFVATIWGSSLGCKSMCCTKRTTSGYGHLEAGQPHIVMVNGQAYTMATGPVVTMPTMDQAGPLPEKKDLKEAFVEPLNPTSPPPPYQ